MLIRMRNKSPRLTLGIIVLAIGLLSASFVLYKSLKKTNDFVSDSDHQMTVTPKAFSDFAKISSIKASIKDRASMNTAAVQFQTVTKHLNHAANCLPIQVGNRGDIPVFYQYCPEEVLETRGKGTVLTDDFIVTDDLARRFNFWRDVYGTYTTDHYVLHVGDYPEVVLEIVDLSKFTDKTVLWKDSLAKKIEKLQKKEYRKLLLELHSKQDQKPSSLSPTLRRIADSMKHIKDKKKYAQAALSLRVQRGQKEFIAEGIPAASSYMPYIEAEFAKTNVPTELAYLAFVESSFNLKAESKVGASGVFQLMRNTAQQYIKVDGSIDERNDPVKASRAAAKLLAFNYKMAGSWPLAITAYNHGIGGVRRGVDLTGSQDLGTLIKYYRSKQFGFASQNFYSSFLAILATLKNWHTIFPDVKTYTPLKFQVVRLNKPMAVSKIQKKYMIPVRDIKRINPDISRTFLHHGGRLPRGYEIKIPLVP